MVVYRSYAMFKTKLSISVTMCKIPNRLLQPLCYKTIGKIKKNDLSDVPTETIYNFSTHNMRTFDEIIIAIVFIAQDIEINEILLSLFITHIMCIHVTSVKSFYSVSFSSITCELS